MITEAEIECRLDDSYKEGVEKGIEQGSLNAKREMAKGLRDAGVSISIISKQSGLSEEEIKSL